MAAQGLDEGITRGVDQIDLHADLRHVLLEQRTLVLGGGDASQLSVINGQSLAILDAVVTLLLPAGLVQTLLSSFRIVVVTRRVIPVAGLTRHKQVVAQHQSVRTNRQARKVRLGDSGTVDALDDSLTHLLIGQHRRLGVEGEMAPLQRTSLTHLDIWTLLGSPIAILSGDV